MDEQGKDDKAAKEAAAFDNGNLDEEARANDHKRKEKRKDHKNNLIIRIMWVIVSGVGIISIIWLVHLLFPCFRWLSNEDLNKVETVLFSGVISSLVSLFIKENI